MSRIVVNEIEAKAGNDVKFNSNIANPTTVKGEGSATTNLQNGLVKHWVNIDGDTPSARDSINNASLTDNGSGNYTITRTNNFSAVNYCCQGGGNSSASGDGRMTTLDEATLSTSANEIFNRSDANGVQDDAHVNISFLGDLA